MKLVVVVLVAAVTAAPAVGQVIVAPRNEMLTAPPAVTLERKPETYSDQLVMLCRKPEVDEQGNIKPTPEGCRIAPPETRGRHPDYGKGKLYSLIPG